jgi:uncharacterized protein YndB with AHSA1/START domain
MSMTQNPPSVIDEEAFTVRRTIAIVAPVEKVWSAVTDPEHISRWFGRVELTGREAGATGTMSWPGRVVPLQIEAVDEPRMVSYRWGNDDASDTDPEVVDEHSTVFTFTLEATAEGTQLTVVETGFENTSDPAVNLAEHAEGWVSELDKLVALVESGE